MTKNRVFASGRNLTLPVLAGTVTGSPVIVGMIPGVALTNRDSNGNASVQTGDGVFQVSVTGALANVGAPVYIVSATYALVVAPGAGNSFSDTPSTPRAQAQAPSESASLTTPSPSVRRPNPRGESHE